LRKSGRQCPAIAAAPVSAPARWPATIVATNTGTNPFTVSRKTAGNPSFRP
jgi:hypothetical protein